MNINEKLAQRRREREQEAAVLQVQIAAQEAEKTAFIKQEAKKRLVKEGLQNVIDVVTEKAIQREKEKIIEEAALIELKNRKVQERKNFEIALSGFSKFEGMVVFILLLLVIWGFFQSWSVGFFFLIAEAYYFNAVLWMHRSRLISAEDALNDGLVKIFSSRFSRYLERIVSFVAIFIGFIVFVDYVSPVVFVICLVAILFFGVLRVFPLRKSSKDLKETTKDVKEGLG